jgi:phage-related protein
MEVVSHSSDGTYRAVYTVAFAEALYVLHAFQKKSKRGTATPKQEIERMRQRLKLAIRYHAAAYEKGER